MFVYKGIVYGGEPEKGLSAAAVRVLPDHMMLITFSNGEIRLFDADVLQGEVFKPLADENNFKSAYVDHGVITWMDGEIDCAPEFLYQNSYEYPSPVAVGE